MAIQSPQTAIEEYVRQWLQTAGSFSVEFSWGFVADPFARMRVRCKKCHQTLTCNIPEDSFKMDWAMQQFVKIHAHEVLQMPTPITAPTPMTVDFKSVPVPVRVKRQGRRFRETN